MHQQENWPEQDKLMWAALIAPGGPLDSPGAFVHLRDATLYTRRMHYRQWLLWLEARDADALKLPPAERASMDRLRQWLDELAHTRPMTRLSYMQALITVLRAYAPQADWTAQKRMLAVLKHQAGNGDPARKAGRILCSGVLLRTGIVHAGCHAEAATTELSRMIRRRDGTIVALLAILPMRARSLSMLALGQSVHVAEESVIIALSEQMTKTGVAWETSVNGPVNAMLRDYISAVRPWLMARGGRSHTALWVGRKGEAISQTDISIRVRHVTEVQTGKRIPPHFFRDAAATTLARSSTNEAGLIRPVLAHSGFRTAQKHYIQARTIDAGRDYASVLMDLKGGHR
ncbi:hypothetical protein DRW48_04015 [Paracoccus suum]|uniref:Tyr recombinase domain-containing protein n=1 Tax=Paracoccus suum TaxID=2259340 RepID=A0A344PHW8_9RHOB|nr:tyrosine-type recombinase/integrase [Paracoccus suum]AXC48973.1 hypothetical protein DRW48_04015 [Paracoccus suum]